MFSRVILRRIDPAAAASGQSDDIENQPLSPRAEGPEPEMSERSGGVLPRLGIRRPTIPSRFRFSSSTEGSSVAGADWPGTHTSRISRANTHPAIRPNSSHYNEEDDDDEIDRDMRLQSTLPSRYSVVVDLPSTRLHLPGLQRTWTQGSNGPPTARPAELSQPQRRPSQRAPSSPVCRPHTPPATTPPPPPVLPLFTPTEPPRVVALGPPSSSRLGSEEADELYPVGDRRSRGFFTAADPAENHLASLAADGRRRQHRSRGSNGDRRRHRRDRVGSLRGGGGGGAEGSSTTEDGDHGSSGRRRRRQRVRDLEDGDEDGTQRPHPKHFLFCFPWIKSRKVRSQILQCFVSGIFLILLVSIYFALSVTKNITNSEFAVLLILIILFATIFFCQGLIRLCLLVFRPKPVEERRRSRLPNMYGPGGYAIPRQPIRVVLARDEEAAGIESETTKISPPAYGLWRESVRVDPNRIYWQRNTEALSPTTEEHEMYASGDNNDESGESSSSGEEGSSSSSGRQNTRRPPSYASEDGVSYIIEARPRSTAPSSNVQIIAMPSPMPAHPSEAGRTATPPRW